jgi:hypothetical protein
MRPTRFFHSSLSAALVAAICLTACAARDDAPLAEMVDCAQGSGGEPIARGGASTLGGGAGIGGGVTTAGSGGSVPVSGSGGSATAGAAGALTGGPARDVQLTLVEANQATAVALSDASLEPTTERSAPLIAGRPALVRAHFKLSSSFAPHELSAVLSLSRADNVEERRVSMLVTKSSETDDLASTFDFLLSSDDVTADLALSVELQERAPNQLGNAFAVRFPKQGRAALGAKSGAMELYVVIVPALTQGGSPVSSPERRARIEKHLFDLYPVQKVSVAWREPAAPEDATDRLTSYELLRDMCQREHAAPNVLYHLIIRREDSGFGFRGISLGENSATLACSAVGITVVENAAGEDVAYVDGTETPNGGNPNTIAHELSHNHGRRHVLCGDVANPDLEFPYEDGFLGAQGYSLSENALKPTNQFKELMGYCSPRWVSDWTWSHLEERVRVMTGYGAAKIESGSARLLSGLVTADGQARWAIVPGKVDVAADGQATLHFADHDENASFSYSPSSQGDLGEVRLALPSGALPRSAELTAFGTVHRVELAKVKNHAR